MRFPLLPLFCVGLGLAREQPPASGWQQDLCYKPGFNMRARSAESRKPPTQLQVRLYAEESGARTPGKLAGRITAAG